ncbi:NAD-dependent epimerase/dehydratase family protein [Nocardioides eburneiflavus]|uniref:NAD-dependent epimerase/dehydratase family protein n=1 Tax=Nocardioides eburneiflavus TaxID=2518372 RepID=A0A4Z1BQP0_9ACTN|nr:NAD(P)H-binding protein [Nocardioides eburneiflavus]TGN63661.1 NAD-dependent epimerase/dehydratase family protein [Nocardioides eburneiflavus]
MRVLVLGATGYIGSRLVPHLLEHGHDVVAASSSPPRPDRFGWDDRVHAIRCDVTDPAAVLAAVDGVDAVVYLVHSLDRSDFSDRDRVGAETVAAVVREAGVRRVVYLSGLVPDVPEADLSAHISSRLEVERILLGAADGSVALRAGVVIGAGSTSFEIIRQVATLFLVQPVPTWMDSSVQPVAVSDVLRAVDDALADDGPRGAVDVGGPDVVAYPDLMRVVGGEAGLSRLRVPLPVAPTGLVGLATALTTTAPFHTVTALIESLRHDMVCRPGHAWEPRSGGRLLGVEEAVRRALTPRYAGPEGALPSDPAWARGNPVLDVLPLPAAGRTAARLALHRVLALIPGA